MVISIDGTLLIKCPSTSDEFYTQYPQLAEKGKSLAHQNAREVEADHCLYVAQGEFGVVPGNDQRITTVGSDDATTCHIVVVRHSSSGTVAVAHFDGSRSEEDAVSAMVNKINSIEGTSERLELCVVGGYMPEKGSSEALKNESDHLSVKILKLFMRHRCMFDLNLWCTCQINTTIEPGIGPKPIVYGIGVDVQTGTVFPAGFKSHEPNIPLRAASRWMGGDKGPHDLYDHITGTITIRPFTYSGVEWFAMYIRLPDEALLRNFSTSPKVEPSKFCQDLRSAFKIFVDHPNPLKTLFPNNQAKRYSINPSGVWELLPVE